MSNKKQGVRVNPLKEWAAFDQLPPPIRRVIALAPYDYAVTKTLNAFKRHKKEGGDVAAFKAELVRKVCDDLQKTARKTYGADHPDALYHRQKGYHPHA